MTYGIRIRKTATDPWQRGVQYRRDANTASGWKYWRNEWPYKKAAELRLEVYRSLGYSGHVFEIPAAFVPEVLKPSEWGSRGLKHAGTPVNLKASTYFVPHYGAIGNIAGPTTKAAAISLLKAFEDFHLDSRGWNGLAYHAAVDKAGRIYIGPRGAASVRGAHTGNAKGLPGDPNSNYSIVLLVGDKEKPTPEMEAAVRWAVKNYGGAYKVRYHREFDFTDCPGEEIPKVIN